jgi:cytochrome P450/NADPH-cytochrome P450 reductase
MYYKDNLRAIAFSRPGALLILCSDPKLTHFVTSDETLFDKTTPPSESPLGLLRENMTPEGIFTNGSEQESWELAHRILLPAFSMKGMKEYYPTLLKQMNRLLSQLDAYPPGYEIDIPDLMTRMTLDSIGACGFDTDFSMIDNKKDPKFVHPFVHAMVKVLGSAQELLGETAEYLNMKIC